MKLVEIEHGLELAKPTEGYIRTSGLHLSDIYNSLYKKLNPERYDRRDSVGNPIPFDPVAGEFGTAFEEVLEPVLRRRIISAERPGEFVTQHTSDCIYRRTTVKVGDSVCACGAGVIYTPDHFFFNGVFYLGEFKTTRMSSAKGLTDRKFDKWFCQIKAQCFHLKTLYARLYVFFILGDWTDKSPEFRAWDIEFTEKELTEEWRMLLAHGKREGLIP